MYTSACIVRKKLNIVPFFLSFVIYFEFASNISKLQNVYVYFTTSRGNPNDELDVHESVHRDTIIKIINKTHYIH